MAPERTSANYESDGSSVPVLLVLRRALNGRQPGLATLDPDLRLGPEVKRRLVERTDANLDHVLVEAAEPRPAAWTEAPPVVVGELA